MKIGIIGVGVVGGALSNWLKENTPHEVLEWDPYKGKNDDLHNTDAIFICTPVRPGPRGQDQKELESTVNFAKGYCQNVFIRSTVLPGTNDRLGTISCPEFLTARISHEEMHRLPILCGIPSYEWIGLNNFLEKIFPEKKIIMINNTEAELAKFAHNCFGAMKVTYFNIIYKLCQDLEIDYENVKKGFLVSGFINEPHTQVPGPDGKLGYSGSCFPENIRAMRNYLSNNEYSNFHDLYSIIMKYNNSFRPEEPE